MGKDSRRRTDSPIGNQPDGARRIDHAEIYQSQLWHLRESIERQPDLHLGTVDKKAVFERIRDQFVLQHFAGVCRTKLKGKALERRCEALWTKQGLAAIEKAARKATRSFLYPDEILQSVPAHGKTWPGK